MIWGVLGGLALVVLVVVWVITVSDIVRRHLGRGPTSAWLLIVILLPFLGSLLYWALRRPSAAEVQAQSDAEVALHEERRRRAVGGTGLHR